MSGVQIPQRSQMTILFLARRFYPDIGGVEKHVLEIGKIFVENGHSVTVITQSGGKETQIKGIKVVRIEKAPNNSFEKLHIWKWFWKNRNLIKEADIVHAHDVYFWYFPFRLLYLFKKSFVTFHGYESYPISKRAILVRKFSEKLSNGNIIVGQFIKKWYGTTPDYIIYGGVEISNLLAGRQVSNKLKRESAVFIGRLDEQTGILDFAKAVDLIRKSYPKFEFVIVGDGKYKNKLSRYNVLGFKESPGKYFEKYNFAFVSRYLSILEALANKKLVFALYDNPVKEDYLRMTPFAQLLIIENNPQELAKRVIYYLKNPIKQKKLEGVGYDFVKKQTWGNLVNTYLKLWKYEA